MPDQFEVARAQTLEQLDQLFGHETAHLSPWEQYCIANEVITMFAQTCRDLAEDLITVTEGASNE